MKHNWNVSDVETVTEIDVNTFKNEYMDKKPLLIRGLGENWPACIEWDSKLTGMRYGKSEVLVQRHDPDAGENSYFDDIFERRKITLSEHIQNCKRDDNPLKFWTVAEDWLFFKNYKELTEDLDFVSLIPNWPIYEYALWIGHEGSVTGLHADLVPCNMHYLLEGTKTFTLFPKDQGDLLYSDMKEYEQGMYSNINKFCDRLLPDVDAFPKAADATPSIVEMQAGDVFHIPYGWWHVVRSNEYTMSVTCLPNTRLNLLYQNIRTIPHYFGHGITRTLRSYFAPRMK